MDYSYIIPIFDGAEKDVIPFIEGCDAFLENFGRIENYDNCYCRPIEEPIMEIIRTRLAGEAKELFDMFDMNFAELSCLVQNRFVKNHSEVPPYGQYDTIVKSNYLSYGELAQVIEAKKNELLAGLKNEKSEIRRLKTTLYERKALKYFKKNLTKSLAEKVSSPHVETLRDALSRLLRLELDTSIDRDSEEETSVPELPVPNPLIHRRVTLEELNSVHLDSDSWDMSISPRRTPSPNSRSTPSNYIISNRYAEIHRVSAAHVNECTDLVPYVPPRFVLPPLDDVYNPYANMNAELRASYGILLGSSACDLMDSLESSGVLDHFGIRR